MRMNWNWITRLNKDRYKEVEGDILLNIKRQAYLDIDYEALESFKFAQSDEEKIM